jgi:hypothetical protein
MDMVEKMKSCMFVITSHVSFWKMLRINMLAKELIIVGSSARGISMISGTNCREGFFR